MPQFEHDGASVHYETMDEGPPLLLIAGTASDAASWGPLLPLLDGRQVIMIDNRGSGQTTVEGPIEIDQMVGDCAALLGHLGLEGVDVVGHSLGGAIALKLAADHPGRVRRLVTMASGTVSKKELVLFRDLARVYFTMVPEDWFRLLYQWLFSAPFFADEANIAAAATASTNYLYRQSPGDFARQVAALERGVTLRQAEVKCPVLALSAELDLLAPPGSVVALHQGVPDVRFATIAGAAHSIHWERPTETAASILEFLVA
jgi:pimeloyl-ACP methyl ester carboxylesterase